MPHQIASPIDPLTDIDEITLPEPITATDRLRTLYRRPGPYTSVYLATRPLMNQSAADTIGRWGALRASLAEQGASPQALDAIDARVALPAPDDTAGVAVVAAHDGTTVVDYGQEPPGTDFAVLDSLPYAAPLLEWDQRRVPHLVVTTDESGADIVTFGPDHYNRIDTVDGPPASLVDPVTTLARSIRAELVVVAGRPSVARHLAEVLTQTVPIGCQIVADPEPLTSDQLAEATVRHVADVAARATVGYLRELRYLTAHHSAVDGTADTVAALRNQEADVLLIHDDPEDRRRVWVGPEPHQLSLETRTGYPTHARLVDAAIRAAVMTDTKIHIIPSTGPTGPEDNTAALRRTHDAPPA